MVRNNQETRSNIFNLTFVAVIMDKNVASGSKFYGFMVSKRFVVRSKEKTAEHSTCNILGCFAVSGTFNRVIGNFLHKLTIKI